MVTSCSLSLNKPQRECRQLPQQSTTGVFSLRINSPTKPPFYRKIRFYEKIMQLSTENEVVYHLALLMRRR